MEKLKAFRDKLRAAWARTEPFRSTVSGVCGKIGYVIRVIWKWIYRLRSIWLTIPVAILAVRLAIYNMSNLPKAVGIYLLSDGTYQWMVDRSVAVMGPMVVTGGCLFLMFCSRRVGYPWLISIFTLLLPILIYITNVFPA